MTFSEQRRSLMKEIEFYIEMAELEQQVQLSGKLPTVQEYRRRRMGTSAVGVCLAITESVDHSSHPIHEVIYA